MVSNELPVWTRRLGPWQLQTLLEIDRSGSISAAASRMATTQPGLSKWLKDLEDVLGVVLFERTTRRLRPTPYGRIVLRLAEQIVGDTLRMHEEIRALQAGRLGQVKIGMLPGLGATLVPEALAWLMQQNLRLEVVLRENTLEPLLAELREHKLDLLVARLDRQALNAGVHLRQLFEEPACVMAPVNHPLRQHALLEWSDLAGQPWILPLAGSPMRYWLESAFERAGFATPQSVLESSANLLNRATARKLGCLFVCTALTASELERDGTVARLPVRMVEPPAPVGVLWAVEALGPQQKLMLEALEAAVQAVQEGQTTEGSAGGGKAHRTWQDDHSLEPR